jgi:hypothetical protein
MKYHDFRKQSGKNSVKFEAITSEKYQLQNLTRD